MHFKNRVNIFENSEKFTNIVFGLSESALQLVNFYLLSITTKSGYL